MNFFLQIKKLVIWILKKKLKQVDKQPNTNSTNIVFGWGEKGEDEKEEWISIFVGSKKRLKR